MNCEDEGEMAASHRRPHSPATGPLNDDDLLWEIILRLPPQPSSLPRASAVCKRWRRLVSVAGFFRRFRIHHRRNPPLLGFFDMYQLLPFLPTLEASNRVPPGRFSLQRGDGDGFLSFGCRHGLFLIFLLKRLQVLVWDPVTGDQHRLAIPPGIATHAEKPEINGAVFRTAGDVHFQVVLVMADNDDNHRRAFACVNSSETGVWGDLISTPIPSEDVFSEAVLVGNSLYWLLHGHFIGILEFDLDRQRLAVIQVPVDVSGQDNFTITRTEGGGLGFLFISDFSAQLWNRKANCNGVASWVLGSTIELEKLLSLNPEEERGSDDNRIC